MIQRIKRFLNSREYRKLTRDWLTIASIWVIGAYLLTGVALMCGAITAETCDTVFGPNKLQGFYQVELPERRYEAATTKFIQKVQAALGQDDPATALSEVEVGLHRVADKSPAELQTLVDQALELKAELNTSENLDEDPAMLPKLEQLEAAVEEMKQPLSGWGRFVQNCALLLGTDSQGRSIFLPWYLLDQNRVADRISHRHILSPAGRVFGCGGRLLWGLGRSRRRLDLHDVLVDSQSGFAGRDCIRVSRFKRGEFSSRLHGRLGQWP